MNLQTFSTNTPFLHRYAFGAILASATVLSHFNVLAFNKSELNSSSDIKTQFIELDKDHNLKLSHDESYGDWELQPHFNKADFNGDGVLEMSEYLNFKNALQLTIANNSESNIGGGLIVNGIVVKGVIARD